MCQCQKHRRLYVVLHPNSAYQTFILCMKICPLFASVSGLYHHQKHQTELFGGFLCSQGVCCMINQSKSGKEERKKHPCRVVQLTPVTFNFRLNDGIKEIKKGRKRRNRAKQSEETLKCISLLGCCLCLHITFRMEHQTFLLLNTYRVRIYRESCWMVSDWKLTVYSEACPQ